MDLTSAREMRAMTIDEAIDQMTYCATVERCIREDACFQVVRWARIRRKWERLAENVDSASAVDADEVADYAPDWSAA